MSLERINYHPEVTQRLVAGGRLREQPFSLIDVGCSGGLGEHWRAFGDQFRAVGFDPQEDECERLAAAEKSANTRYVAAWVGEPDYESHLPAGMTRETWRAANLAQFTRTSTAAAQALLGADNPGPAPRLTSRTTSVDAFVSGERVGVVDFIKIDTDGSDFEVILGARRTIAEGVLGLQVETQLHGIAHDYANTWSNIDRYLREMGFALFDFDVYRCSRAAFPDGFRWDDIGVTYHGQVSWAESLYLLDPGNPATPDAAMSMTDMQLMKMLCLFEVYGLPDCAAELLLAQRERFEGLLDVQKTLDWLVQAWWPGGVTYESLISSFRGAPESFKRSGAYGQAALRMAAARQRYLLPAAREANPELSKASFRENVLDFARRLRR